MLKLSICIDVSDLKQATAFYCEALGCELTKEQESHNTLTLDGTTVHLSLKAEGSEATRVGDNSRTYERHWTPVHLDFDVEDLDQAVADVLRLGGTEEETKSGDWGSASFCADPFGNGFCLLKIA